MLTQKQISEIREHLDKAQNPLFFFDNDQDGLCSFLLLARYLARGKGVAVKSAPLDKSYFRKIEELNPDYVFVVDVPTISKDFWEEVEKINLPVVWIDHHVIPEKDLPPKWANYYNPMDKDSPPNTYLCYQVTNKKEDLWLAVIGCIADRHVPEYYKDFQKLYPDLTIDSKDASEIYYDSELGKIIQLLGAGLKDKTTNVVKMLKFLIKAKSPYEILEDNSHLKDVHEKFNFLKKKYDKFISKAREQNTASKLLFFEYGGESSMSSELANGLSYIFQDKIVFVAYTNGSVINISGRGEGVKKILEKVLKNFPDAVGGGHERAIGGKIQRKDLDEFKKELKEVVEGKEI